MPNTRLDRPRPVSVRRRRRARRRRGSPRPPSINTRTHYAGCRERMARATAGKSPKRSAEPRRRCRQKQRRAAEAASPRPTRQTRGPETPRLCKTASAVWAPAEGRIEERRSVARTGRIAGSGCRSRTRIWRRDNTRWPWRSAPARAISCGNGPKPPAPKLR